MGSKSHKEKTAFGNAVFKIESNKINKIID